VDEILKEAEKNSTERQLMFEKVSNYYHFFSVNFNNIQLIILKGGVVQIIIDWSCNYDILSNKQCQPQYSFRRFDLPFNDIGSVVSSGFNFR